MIADHDFVFGQQAMEAATFAVDQDAVGAAEVFDESLLRRGDQLTMLTADELTVETQPRVFGAAHHQAPGLEHHAADVATALLHLELRRDVERQSPVATGSGGLDGLPRGDLARRKFDPLELLDGVANLGNADPLHIVSLAQQHRCIGEHVDELRRATGVAHELVQGIRIEQRAPLAPGDRQAIVEVRLDLNLPESWQVQRTEQTYGQ